MNLLEKVSGWKVSTYSQDFENPGGLPPLIAPMVATTNHIVMLMHEWMGSVSIRCVMAP